MAEPRAPRVPSVRIVVAGALAAALLGGTALVAAGAAAPPPRASSAPRTPSCTTAGLVEWIDSQYNGAAGTLYYTLEFTNLSGHACTLAGYPGVSGVTLTGRQIGSAAVRDATFTARTVTVGIDRTVTAVLGVKDVGIFPRSQCRPTTAAGLRVYAPNQRAPKLIPIPLGACARAAQSYLSIQPVTRS